MFKNEFQGGTFLEVLNIQGKDLSSKCKILGTSLNGGSREFDKSIKSYVLLLEGESTRTKVTIPKDTKQSLCLLQSYLVLQLWVATGSSFSLEATITDSMNQKRRILLSTSYKDISVTSFHVKIPLATMKRGIWLNFCLDLKSIVEGCFKGQSFKTIDSIVICANCKLRKVFTLRSQPKDDFIDNIDMADNGDVSLYEEIPKPMQIIAASDVQYGTQVFNMEMLKSADIKFRVGSGVVSSSNSGTENGKTDKPQKTHIAFGSRVAVPKHSSKTGNSGTNLERQTSNVSMLSNSSLSLSSSQNDFNSSLSSIPQIEGQRPVLQPRPPKPNSGRAIRRPNPRIRSAERVRKRPKLKSVNGDNDDGDDCIIGSQIEGGKRNAEIVNKVVKDSKLESNGMKNEEVNNNADENNNNEGVIGFKKSAVNSVSEKLIEMKMGSQEDEEEYFRKRNDSESQDDSIRSKEGSFSSTAGSEPFFLYSSRPRSIQINSKARKNSESASKNSGNQDDIEKKKDLKAEVTVGINVIASLESDFHRDSSDSEAEDPITKMHRLNGNRRSSPSPIFFEKHGENAKIRSSLLKEISRPINYDHLKYQSVQSDSMSWMYDSDSSQAISHNQSDHISKHKLSPVKVDNDISPRNRQLKALDGLSESNEIGSDSEDILSDASDETSYSVWKEPPPHIRNYRYQDEMHGVGMTLDLSATLPMTPFIEEKSPVKDQGIDNGDSGISLQGYGQHRSQESEGETELDLLYDPVLNCYYDPKSHKYYELA